MTTATALEKNCRLRERNSWRPKLTKPRRDVAPRCNCGKRAPATCASHELPAACYGTLTIRNCTVAHNSASGGGFFDEGGGLFNAQGGTLTVDHSTVTKNSATEGGGIYNDGGNLSLLYSTVSGNSALDGADVFTLNHYTSSHSHVKGH